MICNTYKMEEFTMNEYFIMPFLDEPGIPDFPNRPWDDDEE